MRSEHLQSQACWSGFSLFLTEVEPTEANAYKEFTAFLPPSLFHWG